VVFGFVVAEMVVAGLPFFAPEAVFWAGRDVSELDVLEGAGCSSEGAAAF
jgi:hypothetical protein